MFKKVIEFRRKIVYSTCRFHTTGGLVEFTTGSMDVRSRPPGQPSRLPRWSFCIIKIQIILLQRRFKNADVIT